MLRDFDILDLLIRLPAVLFAISIHEFCHGYSAKLLGDRTAEMQGRLTLNPLKHIDPIGTLMLLVAGFGWAKPVPVNSRYFKHPRRDMVIVSLAGIVGNLLTAFVFVIIIRIIRIMPISAIEAIGAAGIGFIDTMIIISVILAAFNILPIPPLDGSKILYGFIPFQWLKFYYDFERYGSIILLVIVFTNKNTNILDTVLRPIIRYFLILVGYFS